MRLLKSILTVGGWTFISRIAGFVRDMLIARFLGASLLSDAFFVSLRFPNLFRSLFAEGSLNVSFLPIFSGLLHSEGKERAKQFAKEAFSFMFYLLLTLTLIIELCMPWLIFVLVPGFDNDPGKLAITASLSRVTFPFLLCVSLVSLFSCILNALGKFAAAAFTPTLMNLVMIFFLAILHPYFPNPAFALAWGVFASGLLELLFLGFCVYKKGYLFGLLSPLKVLTNPSCDLKLLLKRMIPGVFGSGIYQINLFVDTYLVSFLGTGAVSWINYANRLFQLPVGIIGVAIGTALLPLLSEQIKKKEMQKAYESMNRSLEFSLIMSLSAMFGLIILAVPIIRILFQRGAFTYEDTLQIAPALQAFAIGLPAYLITKTLIPFFYARGDTKTPVRVSTIGLIMNIFLAMGLMLLWGHIGIALATGLTAWINAGQYIYLVRREKQFHLDALFKRRFLKIIISVLTMSLLLLTEQEVIVNTFGSWGEQNSFTLSFFFLSILIVSAMISFAGMLFETKAFRLSDIKLFFSRKGTDDLESN
jgi:putative peptidoglycan lipid II flippase